MTRTTIKMGSTWLHSACVMSCSALISIGVVAGTHGDFFWMAISIAGAMGWGVALSSGKQTGATA